MRKKIKPLSIIEMLMTVLAAAYKYLVEDLISATFPENPIAIFLKNHVGITLLCLWGIVAVLRLRVFFKYEIQPENLKKYLDHLHERYFAHGIGLHPDFRISIHVPNIFRESKLVLLTRSGNAESEKKSCWSTRKIKGDVDGIKYDGFISYVWITGTMFLEHNLPKFTPGRPEYRKRTHLTSLKAEEVTLKARSIISVPIQDRAAKKRGILTIEGKAENSLNHLTTEELNGILKTMQCLML